MRRVTRHFAIQIAHAVVLFDNYYISAAAFYFHSSEVNQLR